jgi:serine protease AprX
MNVIPRRSSSRLVAVLATAALLGAPAGIPAPGADDDAQQYGTSRTTASGGVGSPAFHDGDWGDDTTQESQQASSTGEWRADADQGSLHWITKHYGAQQAWTQEDPNGRKVTGKGVTVAVIDTGVAPVEGLTTTGKVVNGPDLSFESQAENTRYLDGYGHGTHMAGIIAGRDNYVSDSNLDDPRNFVGLAPGARILNMKVGTADGGVDVSQVIAAIDWVVQHRNDNGMNVRVLNLSYGTPSTQSYLLDPLAHAVENAWRAGIVVVAAAGNDYTSTPRLTMPAADPYVIAVGAVNHVGTADPRDDVVADFTNGGSATRRPDLLAPGKSVVSLRVPGSMSDVKHPEGRISGETTGRSFRGSGTSQAAAVVSGAAALLLQARPSMTPDQMKALLTRTADPLVQNPVPAMGDGVLDIRGAMEAATPSALWSRQTWQVSTGKGTLEASRGPAHVVDPANGVALTGETDALGNPWDARSWSRASSGRTAWSGGTWNGGDWSGTQWSASSWSGAAWEARSWSARSWSGIDWLARSWSDDTWAARSWSASDWLARSWSNNSWGARSWSGGGR